MVKHLFARYFSGISNLASAKSFLLVVSNDLLMSDDADAGV